MQFCSETHQAYYNPFADDYKIENIEVGKTEFCEIREVVIGRFHSNAAEQLIEFSMLNCLFIIEVNDCE